MTIYESVRDRLATSYEHVFMFAKSRRYWFDLDAIREGRKYEHQPRETNKHAAQRGDQRYGGNPAVAGVAVDDLGRRGRLPPEPPPPYAGPLPPPAVSACG